MATRVIATSISFTVEKVDVLYVAQQINMDLTALSKTYPKILAMDRAMNLFNAGVTFLANYAVSEIGYSVHDPNQKNLVYHELKYQLSYGGNVTRGGKGGRPISAVWVPSSAKFTPWVIWSSTMLRLSEYKQRQIVSGTNWNIPGKNGVFRGRYDGGNWKNGGDYRSGGIRASAREYSLG